jgi:CubicO group peptidase (beta-lactamase class C family)
MAFLSQGISLANVAGQSYEYSNLGFAILGHIITKVSGQSFDKYITANILVPLHMDHTYWEYSDVPAATLAHGYRFINNQWKEEELLHAGAFGATGGLLTTVEDFSKYMMLHLSAWPIGNQHENRILAAATLREMHGQGVITRVRKQSGNLSNPGCFMITSYNDGLVWSKDCSGILKLQHTGGLPGFGSNWVFLPDYDIAIVSMTNLTYGAGSELDSKVADTLIQIAGLEPRVIHPSAILQLRKKQLLQVLPGWDNPDETGIFSENFFKDYLADSLRKDAKFLFTKIGRVTNTSDVFPVNQLRGYFTITGVTGELDIWFTLTPEKPALIQEYKISGHFK